MVQDAKLAMRQLRKSPGFAATVILTLTLGIGANTAIFTLVHGILLKALPVVDPAMLYRIGDKDDCCVYGGFPDTDTGDFDLFSYPLYQHLVQSAPEFEQVAALQAGHNTINVRRGSEPARSARSEYVSGNYFSTFGVGAFLGRSLLPSDDVPGAAPVAVLSYQAWQADYASDPHVIGSPFSIQNRPFTVVGVAQPGFFGDRIASSPPAFWIPLADEPVIETAGTLLKEPASNWLYAIGRLKPGVSLTSLQAKLSASLRQWLATQPTYVEHGYDSQIPKQHVVLTPAGAGVQNLQQRTGKGLHLLTAISAFVLLVACANIANLMLARGSARREAVTFLNFPSDSTPWAASRVFVIRPQAIESAKWVFRMLSKSLHRQIRFFLSKSFTWLFLAQLATATAWYRSASRYMPGRTIARHIGSCLTLEPRFA